MLIHEDRLQHWIDHFYGYGSWSAPIWLIAHEDGGGDLPEEVAEKIDYFQEVHQNDATLCDIREFYQHLLFRTDRPKANSYSNLFDFRFGQDAVQSSVWKNLIAFVFGYSGKPLPDLLEYQKHSFALNNEALLRLYPLPSPHNHSWYYSWVELSQINFLKSRAQYEDHVYPQRIQVILQNVAKHRPQLVLMYGMNNVNRLKESVLQKFPSAKFKSNKAVKLVTPQYHIAHLDGTKLVITTQIPSLRHNRIETGFDWQEFGVMVRG